MIPEDAIEHVEEAAHALRRSDPASAFRELSKAMALLIESSDLELADYAHDDIPYRLEEMADTILDFGQRV